MTGRVRALEQRLTELEHHLYYEIPLPAWRRSLRAIKRWVVDQLAPPAGVLRQYPPRPVRIPDSYRRARPPENPPPISIVTPSLNQGRFLGEAIQSVVDQDYPRAEHIVQDGGSTDETSAVLARWADHIDWRSEPDTGQSDAINRGFARSSGEILGWLNADDALLPGALATVASVFDQNPDVDVVYGHRLIVNQESYEIGRWVMPAHDDRVLTFADYVPQETLFWRRRVWNRAGGRVDDALNFAMDWDLLLRFRAVGAAFLRIPRFLAAFRVHPDQKTRCQLATSGSEEMSRLRERQHGRRVSQLETGYSVRRYLDRSAFLHSLLRMGVIRH